MVCQDRAVDWAPTDTENGPVNVVITPLSIKFLSLASSGFKPKGRGVKSGRSDAHTPDKLGMSCKANKCSDAGTRHIGVLRAHETSPCLGDAGSTHPR